MKDLLEKLKTVESVQEDILKKIDDFNPTSSDEFWAILTGLKLGLEIGRKFVEAAEAEEIYE